MIWAVGSPSTMWKRLGVTSTRLFASQLRCALPAGVVRALEGRDNLRAQNGCEYYCWWEGNVRGGNKISKIETILSVLPKNSEALFFSKHFARESLILP